MSLKSEDGNKLIKSEGPIDDIFKFNVRTIDISDEKSKEE